MNAIPLSKLAAHNDIDNDTLRLNMLIMYAKYAVYVTYIYAENNKVMFHEFSIFSIFKRLIRNRLNIEKYCKDKFLCVLKIL